MSSLGFLDILKVTFKVVEFKIEQSRLTTYSQPIVQTPLGSVRGVKRLTLWGDEYYSFERIPFAKPPLGELRFRAPQPVEPWEGILDCTGPAEKPLQSNMYFRKYKGSEDCLYLNVFTRNTQPERLQPVMVWIYGGGFQIGEASRDMYSPDFFMSKDVVLVTIAYRLGAFGFLSVDDPAVNIPGNAGLKDQILSLKWVHDNIASFGGDPNNVTLFGESAGGASTHLCMLSDRSKGLIHRGIVMSGSVLCPWVRPPKKNWAFRLAKALGYAGKDNDSEVSEFLQHAKGPEIVKATAAVLDKEEKHHRVLFAFGPTLEPYQTDQCVISEEPYEMLKTTWSNTIPMMIGGTSFEGLLFHPEITRRPATLDEVKNCKNLLPADLNLDVDSPHREDFGLKLKTAYFGDNECNPQSKFEFLDVQTYREFWHPIYRTILARRRYSSAPTYVYRFDFDSRDGNAIRNLLCGKDVRGVCHGDDLCYLYHSMFAHRAAKDSPEYNTTKAMIDIWTSFAATSDPNCETLKEIGVQFQPVTDENDVKCLNISEKLEFIPLPELDKINVWNDFYPQGKL